MNKIITDQAPQISRKYPAIELEVVPQNALPVTVDQEPIQEAEIVEQQDNSIISEAVVEFVQQAGKLSGRLLSLSWTAALSVLYLSFVFLSWVLSGLSWGIGQLLKQSNRERITGLQDKGASSSKSVHIQNNITINQNFNP